MINEEFPIEKKEATEYKPLPEDIYQVELLDVNVESRPTYDTRLKPEAEQEMEKTFNFQFVLLDGEETNTEGKKESLRGRNVWANFVPSYLYISKKNGENKLYQIVKSFLNASELSPEHEAKLDTSMINSFIGKQLRVAIKNTKKDDSVYSNIETYYSAKTQLTPLTDEEKENATVKKDDDSQADDGTATDAELEAAFPSKEEEAAEESK